MSITLEEPPLEGQPPSDPRNGRQLFGTLLASKPARGRSPAALALSVIIHLAFIALLVTISHPFIPKLAHKLFEDVTIIVPEEPGIVITRGGGGGAPAPASSERERREAQRDEPLRFTPGPIAPIPDITPGPETPEPSEGGVGERGAGAPRSLADRLRPRTIDPRLSGGARYAPPGAAAPLEGVESRIARSLDAYNDSVAAETDARRRALDWTIKGKDGKQWGIGPDGKIHLGDITLPAIAFSPPPGRREEFAARARDYAELERQAAQEIGRQSFKERVKAIRARKERERAEKKKNEAVTN